MIDHNPAAASLRLRAVVVFTAGLLIAVAAVAARGANANGPVVDRSGTAHIEHPYAYLKTRATGAALGPFTSPR